LPEFIRLRQLRTPSPQKSASAAKPTGIGQLYDPWGRHATTRVSIAKEFGCATSKDTTDSKAFINQLSKKSCPFASDRRFLGGEWLFKSSQLHKSEPVPDKHYLSVYEKRPLTQSRKPGPFTSQRSTRQIVAMIHQHMTERSRSSKTASRIVDNKHPMRALMNADVERKGFLTLEQLRECLERMFVIVLDEVISLHTRTHTRTHTHTHTLDVCIYIYTYYMCTVPMRQTNAALFEQASKTLKQNRSLLSLF
jgi:hypothetical protein